MNIDWFGSSKKHAIRTMQQQADIDDNFDLLFQDMVRNAASIAAKKIDISSADDITGQLATSRLAGYNASNTVNFLRQDGQWALPPQPTGFIQQSGNRRFSTEHMDAGGVRGFGFGTTFSASGSASSFQDAVSYWERLTTGAVVGAVLSTTSGGINIARLEHQPLLQVYLRTGSSIANLRLMAGIYNAAPDMTTDAQGATVHQGAFFRYSTPAADPGWMGVTVGNDVQAVSSGQVGAIAASTTYLLQISVRAGGTVVDFSINGGVVTSVNIATVATGKELKARVDAATRANSAITVDFSRWYYEAN